jgi:hypothetical protein
LNEDSIEVLDVAVIVDHAEDGDITTTENITE